MSETYICQNCNRPRNPPGPTIGSQCRCTHPVKCAECERLQKQLEQLQRLTGVAGNCVKCGGPIFHRPGHPGEFDHPECEVKGCDHVWMEPADTQLSSDARKEVRCIKCGILGMKTVKTGIIWYGSHPEREVSSEKNS